MAPRTPVETRTRLLEAGAELFAAQGFHGTTVREIAERAGVNLAAGHYHFGSKRDLYLEVFRAHFGRVRDELRQRGASPDPAQLAHLSRQEAVAVLRERMRAMLDQMMATSPPIAPLLMQREMADPTEALPVIVREFIRPMTEELEAIVGRIAPDLDEIAVTRSTMSIIGQALFYQFAKPAVLRVLGETRYSKDLAVDVADHITAFSLGGLAAASRPRERRRSRAR